jgi:hypothetical protein
MRSYTNFGLKPPSAFIQHEELMHSIEAHFPAAAVEPRFPAVVAED